MSTTVQAAVDTFIFFKKKMRQTGKKNPTQLTFGLKKIPLLLTP
jgi:hypothetical protein